MQLALDFFEEVLATPQPPAVAEPLDLLSYDYYLVMFSGGKDSEALYLALREAGVPNEKIELWHQDVDGREGSQLMTWPCERAYCRKFAQAFGVPIYFSWREGGFEREMLRDGTCTAPIHFEQSDGTIGTTGGDSDRLGTRLRFPQQSANLSVRWCSGSLKIDVAAAAIRNQPRFNGKRTLILTGERAEESAARACYEFFEPHRTDRRRSEKLTRHVDHLRLIHSWSEEEVWAIIARWRVNPSPVYRLGWSRKSCAACIFANTDQWASLRAVNPPQFNGVAGYERQFGCTIRRDRLTVVEAADAGRPYTSITPALIAEALDENWDGPIILPAGVPWVLPAGAFGESAGPS